MMTLYLDDRPLYLDIEIPELLLSLSVNYWYDMQFDIKYNYYNFLQNVNSVNRLLTKIWEGYEMVIEKVPYRSSISDRGLVPVGGRFPLRWLRGSRLITPVCRRGTCMTACPDTRPPYPTFNVEEFTLHVNVIVFQINIDIENHVPRTCSLFSTKYCISNSFIKLWIHLEVDEHTCNIFGVKRNNPKVIFSETIHRMNRFDELLPVFFSIQMYFFLADF